jgi:putative acetyltransferase
MLTSTRIMTSEPLIRSERPDDHAAIGDVIRAAFHGKPYAEGDEAELVDLLREKKALTVSLVAELNGSVVGQIAFSPAFPSDGAAGWYTLGPVAVLPEHQGRGIGSLLIRTGLQAIRDIGAEGCILTGDPKYYVRFGFVPSPQLSPSQEEAEYFLIKLLGDRQPVGPIRFDEAFTPSA